MIVSGAGWWAAGHKDSHPAATRCAAGKRHGLLLDRQDRRSRLLRSGPEVRDGGCAPSTCGRSSGLCRNAWRGLSGSLDYAVSLDGPPCMSELPAGTKPARLKVGVSPRPPWACKPGTELGAAPPSQSRTRTAAWA